MTPEAALSHSDRLMNCFRFLSSTRRSALLLAILSAAVPVPAQDLDAPLFNLASGQRTGESAEVAPVPATRDALSRGVARAHVRNVPLAEGGTTDLHLERFDVFSPDARIVEQSKTTARPLARPALTTYRGSDPHQPDRSAFLAAMGRQELFLQIHSPKGGNTLIAPVAEKTGTGARYRVAAGDAELLRDFMCDTDALPANQAARSSFAEPEKQPRLSAPLSLDLVIDVGYPLYQQLGSDASYAAAYAANVMATVSHIYTRDLNVQLKISQLTVWTSPDPFSGAGSSTGDQLHAYASYNTNNRPATRAAAQLLTLRTGFGGIAYLNSLCTDGLAYGVSNLRSSLSHPLSGYHWDVNVVAHELGHNFGSIHTHCYSPPIDCCRDEALASCSCSPVVPQEGTLMSYCHLNGSVSLSFHPRCASVMRSNAEAAACRRTPPPAETLLVTSPAGIAIPSGDLSPAAEDGTAFGGAEAGSGNVKRTYTLHNVGLTTISLDSASPATLSGAHAGDFAVVAQPGASSLSPGTTTTFEVAFVPQSAGPRTAAVVLTASTGTYSFAISGFGTSLLSPVAVSFSGAVSIPDATLGGVEIPISVTGVTDPIGDVDFLIGGSTCTGSGVGITHTWVGDISAILRSPAGTQVILMNRPGASLDTASGDDFCQTLLNEQDDAPSVSSILDSGLPPLGPPYTGTLRPQESLSKFLGEDPNGVWTVRFADHYPNDFGTVRSFSLIVTPTAGLSLTSAEDWSLFQ